MTMARRRDSCHAMRFGPLLPVCRALWTSRVPRGQHLPLQLHCRPADLPGTFALIIAQRISLAELLLLKKEIEFF